MNALTINTPKIQLQDSTMTTTSLNIAEVFNRRHKNVLQKIENLDIPEDFNALNFQPVDTFDKQKATGLSFAASGYSSVWFGRQLLQGVRFATLNMSGGFFVPCFHQFHLRVIKLVELVQEALCLPLLPCRTVDQPASTSPFSLGRGTGVELQGAFQ